jgi:coenzyme Q-binding protein COQ10
MDISVQHRIEGFSAAELFQVAVDVESYPDFLPFCIAAKIVKCDGDELTVDNVFGLGPVRTRFTTKACLSEPDGIVITSNESPFRELTITWSFAEDETSGCMVNFAMKQVFRSSLMERLSTPLAATLEQQLVKNFEIRARKVFKRP